MIYGSLIIAVATIRKKKRFIFVELDESIKMQVELGNKCIIQAQGRETIGVQTKKGTKLILNVLFVPNLDQNFLSLGQLLEHIYALNFDDN